MGTLKYFPQPSMGNHECDFFKMDHSPKKNHRTKKNTNSTAMMSRIDVLTVTLNLN
jgi:hypothetical protein